MTKLLLHDQNLVKIEKTETGYDAFQWKPNLATMKYSWQRFASHDNEEELSEYLDYATEVYCVTRSEDPLPAVS